MIMNGLDQPDAVDAWKNRQVTQSEEQLRANRAVGVNAGELGTPWSKTFGQPQVQGQPPAPPQAAPPAPPQAAPPAPPQAAPPAPPQAAPPTQPPQMPMAQAPNAPQIRR